MNAPETHVRPTESGSGTTTGTAPPPPPPPPPAGFWKLHHLVIGLVVLVVLVMMMRACGSDDEEPAMKSSDDSEQQPRQAIVVQIPASQLPQQPTLNPGADLRSRRQGYGYAPQVAPQVVPPAPPPAPSTNPWSTRQRTHSQSYGSSQGQAWGQPQRNRPQSYTQTPATGSQYRPLDQPQAVAPAPRPAPRTQTYYPVAPYDSLSGSSFGTQPYPYGGVYPGQYGAGAYGVPGGVYAPGAAPGLGWPGYYR